MWKSFPLQKQPIYFNRHPQLWHRKALYWSTLVNRKHFRQTILRSQCICKRRHAVTLHASIANSWTHNNREREGEWGYKTVHISLSTDKRPSHVRTFTNKLSLWHRVVMWQSLHIGTKALGTCSKLRDNSKQAWPLRVIFIWRDFPTLFASHVTNFHVFLAISKMISFFVKRTHSSRTSFSFFIVGVI